MQANFIKLQPIDMDAVRPFWSVIIPTYNCANYLKETLESVLQQDPGENHMEIIVVDDHSTKDHPETVVQELGKGRVQFIQQKENVGKVKNYETGLQASKGTYIHLLHGDDKVRPGFYAEMEEVFKQFPDAGAAFCRSIYIDEQSRWTGMTGMVQDTEGIVPDMAAKLYTEQHIQTPSMVVKREVYEELGTFDRRLNCFEDWEMWIRIANSYPVTVSNQVLALYRSHSANATHQTFQDDSALQTHKLACDIIDGYIQPDIKQKNMRLRSQKQAVFLLLSYKKQKSKLKLVIKFKMIKKILRDSFSLKTIYHLIR